MVGWFFRILIIVSVEASFFSFENDFAPKKSLNSYLFRSKNNSPEPPNFFMGKIVFPWVSAIRSKRFELPRMSPPMAITILELFNA